MPSAQCLSCCEVRKRVQQPGAGITFTIKQQAGWERWEAWICADTHTHYELLICSSNAEQDSSPRLCWRLTNARASLCMCVCVHVFTNLKSPTQHGHLGCRLLGITCAHACACVYMYALARARAGRASGGPGAALLAAGAQPHPHAAAPCPRTAPTVHAAAGAAAAQRPRRSARAYVHRLPRVCGGGSSL